MTRIACGMGLAVLLALTGAAAGQEKDAPFDPAKLIGRWTPVEKKKDEVSVVEFKTGNKVTFQLGAGGKTETYEGTYAVAGQKLKIALKVGEKTITEEVVVTRLTADELHTEDAKGKKEKLRRVQ
ncbi:glycoside hydrolase family 43 C-terminal domain-containing protein [Urbifossiella limnaea]|uniref:Uncharacterized protein n=1 Tax=Urbifossiella limnaea TaxID=2528023 RepID=A0A517XPC2_9BACT|nr:glycoside hydrolase family 43 C-terminal domain-containing protein [Urbifossiella limnaea]QDU19348.1 hypothetical protein ETAA1_12550 [Urbifossiella limnaea]